MTPNFIETGLQCLQGHRKFVQNIGAWFAYFYFAFFHVKVTMKGASILAVCTVQRTIPYKISTRWLPPVST